MSPQPIPTAAAVREEEPGPDGSPEAPCGGWVYPGVVVGGGKEKREKRERKREKGKKAGRRRGIRPGFWRIKGLIIRLG